VEGMQICGGSPGGRGRGECRVFAAYCFVFEGALLSTSLILHPFLQIDTVYRDLECCTVLDLGCGTVSTVPGFMSVTVEEF